MSGTALLGRLRLRLARRLCCNIDKRLAESQHQPPATRQPRRVASHARSSWSRRTCVPNTSLGAIGNMCTRAAMIRRVIRKAGAAEPFAFSAPLAWRRVVNASVVTAFFHAGYRRITSHIDEQTDGSMNGDPVNALEARLDRTTGCATRTKEPCQAAQHELAQGNQSQLPHL